ncbi:MAG: DUF1573 domain-containing protein [Bacteroides sp.]|nr:DUF1573 domain-containing protein [Bacteroides sp.]
MKRLRVLPYLLGFLLLPLSGAAQIRTVSREVLDSIANPLEAEQGYLMKFDTKRIDSGEIAEDDLPVYSFRFVNDGKQPLAISRITTSCGCAVAKAIPMVVAPGDSGKVSVTYHPKGHPGKFERRIFVYTDLSDRRPTAVLSLMTTVRQGADRSLWFPHQMGRIRMKVKEFTFRSDMKDVVCLDFLNTGDIPVTPMVNSAFLPPYIKAWCETPDVAPGKEGEICIGFDPDKFAESMSAGAGQVSGASSGISGGGSGVSGASSDTSGDVSGNSRASAGRKVKIPLILEGLGVPPREATLMLTID